MADNERTAKVIGRALKYHGRWEEVKLWNDWILGPTFMVKGLSYDGPSVQADIRCSAMASAYLAEGVQAAGDPLELDAKGHGRKSFKTGCKKRAARSRDGETRGELDFSLVTLGKLFPVDEWRNEVGSLVLYGYRNKQLVLALAMKTIGDECDT